MSRTPHAGTTPSGSSASPKSQRSRRRTPGTDGLPRATVRQLLPRLIVDRPLMVVILVISIIAAVVTLAQPALMGLLIQAVEGGELPTGLIWTLVGVVLAGALLSGAQHYLLQRTGEKVVFVARRSLVRTLFHLPISELDARRTGDLVSRVGTDTTLLRAVLTQGLIEAVGGSLTFIGAVVAMLLLDPLLFSVTVGVIAISLLVVVLLAGRVRAASAAAQAKVGELTAATERAITSMRTIRAAGATEREQAKVEEDARGAYRRGLDIAAISAVMVPVSTLALQLSLVAVLGIGGVRVASGDLTIASLIAFIMFLFLMVAPLGLFVGAISAVASALGALGRIEEIEALPQEEAHDADFMPRVTLLGPANAEAQPQAPALRFDRVSFRYPDAVLRAAQARSTAGARFDRFTARIGRARSSAADELLRIDHSTPVTSPLVLDEVSFAVPRGARVALVGPSGAGKSTALALIERFYDPTGGAIELGGVDLRSVDRTALRHQLGYVQQNAPTLAGSLRENLLLGRGEASDDECVQALHRVNLGEVLERSGDGLEAQVGEGGVRLSGGEKQRLAIARMLLAAPPVLLLDESTSSLDGRNEALMQEALAEVSQGRTMLTIAHRLSTVVDSDAIIVLDRGRVLGIGRHEQLVETVPLYRELASRQLLLAAE